MYKRKMKLSPIHISLIALAILVVIAVIVTFAVRNDEPKEPMARKLCHSKNIAITERWISFLREIPTMLFYHRECFRLYKRCFRAGAGSSGKE